MGGVSADELQWGKMNLKPVGHHIPKAPRRPRVAKSHPKRKATQSRRKPCKSGKRRSRVTGRCRTVSRKM
jgi:hypothetical protein